MQAAHQAVKKKAATCGRATTGSGAAGEQEGDPGGAAMLVRIAYHMLMNETEYEDLGPDFFDRRDRERSTRRLIRRLEGLGYKVQVQAAA